jgi:alkanesulfonate monooxygenase SsuD/methylene tetrahydromethanopterin reductase-like flavin-dependent oxidoreductase (luciferase family)
MPRRPLISIAIPVHGQPFAQALAVAQAAERAGFDGVCVPDHLVNLTRPQAGVLECWTVLAAVAAATERVRVGPLVIATSFRHPPFLAKQAATLDSIAPGRVVLGLGAGGFAYHATCAQMGLAALSGRDRVTHVEETITCVRQLLAADPVDLSGRFFRTTGARIYPRPERPIPIVVAARRPRMLELTARLADGWNCPLPHELEAGLAALAAHGRRPDTIEVSAYVIAVAAESDAAARHALARAGGAVRMFGDVERHHLWGGPARILDRVRDLARRGAGHLVLDLRGAPRLEAIALLACEVLPHLEC